MTTCSCARGGDLFTIKSDKTGLKRLTNRGDILNAEWSPDKSKIAFTAEVNGNTDVYLMSSTGTGTRRLTFGAARDEDVTWSPNGKTLLFTSFTNCTSDIFKVNVAPGSRPVRFTRAQCDSVSDYFERADWHPDGTKILVWRGYYDGGPGGGGWTAETRSATTGALIKDLGMDVLDMGWSPNGLQIAGTVPAYYADTYKDNVGLWSATGRKLNDVTTSNESYATSFAAWSPDGWRCPTRPRDPRRHGRR
ncbi:hypothetical protein BN11_4670004 [Nostocoides australiense Ben110]|uniref:Uncharacterized protein n=1 Tax=Nostocoides australiense Ben110 TaxID=1193182 RepID=W6JZM1_9MICO|nr:PD40 domain-containing protein [Tetrasphaera australiensis]CCH74662.1 hypothetical protein BN11_4670004 [Tetrasphaera australiensis Ben110]